MEQPVVALSTLGYERELESRLGEIEAILRLPGIDYLHVDVMREPFISGRRRLTARGAECALP